MVPGTFRGQHFPWQVCPLGGAHFKVCESRKTASGIYLWCGFAHFEGRSEKELSYTACSHPDVGCVHMKKNGQGGETAEGARMLVPRATLGHRPVSLRKKSLSLGTVPRHLRASGGVGPSTSGAAQTKGLPLYV